MDQVWDVVAINPNGLPRMRTVQVMASDVQQAANQACWQYGVNLCDIISTRIAGL